MSTANAVYQFNSDATCMASDSSRDPTGICDEDDDSANLHGQKWAHELDAILGNKEIFSAVSETDKGECVTCPPLLHC